MVSIKLPFESCGIYPAHHLFVYDIKGALKKCYKYPRDYTMLYVLRVSFSQKAAPGPLLNFRLFGFV